MKRALTSLLENPPEEDSEDFSVEDANRSIPTLGAEDLVEKVMHQVRGSRVTKFVVDRHELRRKEGHLYYRLRLVATNEPPKVLVYQIDWVVP